MKLLGLINNSNDIYTHKTRFNQFILDDVGTTAKLFKFVVLTSHTRFPFIDASLPPRIDESLMALLCSTTARFAAPVRQLARNIIKRVLAALTTFTQISR